MINNLALTLLHLEENASAYALCRYNLENGLAPSDADRYGYMMNLLVSAHANRIPAAKELKEALEQGYFSFSDLAAGSDKNPGTFSKLLTGMIYNVVYMDTEGSTTEGAASLFYLPQDRLADLPLHELMSVLAAMTEGNPEPAEEIRVQAEELVPKPDYLLYLQGILNMANDWNNKTFKESDPDIIELLTYVDALMLQET